MAGIFINYRRNDAKGEAGRLFDWLSRYFGKDQVFMDVSGSIEPGVEFDKAIEKAVSSCDALIVVIGKEWLTAVDEKGRRRLDDPNDFVRLEIAAALRRDIRVIPVLVQDVAMPAEDHLPDDLKRLSRRQASELSDNRWEFDTEQLVKVLEKIGIKAKAGVKNTADESPQPAQVTKKFKWKIITSLVLSVMLMGMFSDGGVAEESKIGGMVFSLAALVLGIVAHYDLKLNPAARTTAWKVLSITSMVLAGFMFIAFIGTLTTSNPPAQPSSGNQASSNQPDTALSVPAPSVPVQPAAAPKHTVPPPTVAAPAATIDVSGTWRGQDGYYIFQQSGNNVTFNLFAWNQVLLAQGAGTIQQGWLNITYVRADNTGGEARLQVSGNGQQLSGSYRNIVTGEAGPVILVR